MSKGKRINIMSSCDDSYAKLVPVQLFSIADSLVQRGYEVHYYFFHSRVSGESLGDIRSLCGALGIAFHDVQIVDVGPYIEIASKGGSWTYEAYFTLECHLHLPAEVDRVMYIDAADVLILGDIGEYYFTDFEGCSIVATSISYKSDGSGGLAAYESNDLKSDEHRRRMLRGLLNSGSYVINLDKMRQEQQSVQDFLALKSNLETLYPHYENIYFGDQGLLSTAFVGSIKFFGYPEIKNLWYQPYNFCIWFFDRATEICGGNPWYVPKVLHFAGGIKPWKLTGENESRLKPGQWPYYKIYSLYADRVSRCNLREAGS